MKVILISGASDTGKTTICNRIENLLTSKSFNPYSRQQNCGNGQDWLVTFSGKDKNGNDVRIILNYAADTKNTINTFSNYLGQNTSCDILITAIRARGWRRVCMEQIINTQNTSDIMEIPLAEVTDSEDSANSPDPISQYHDRCEKLIETILSKTYSLF